MEVKQVFVALVVFMLIVIISVQLIPSNVVCNTREIKQHLSQMYKDYRRTGHVPTNKTIYLFARRYNGQQGAGVNAITSLQCWVGQTGLPIKIVEPVVWRTELMSSLNQKSSYLELGDYFDINYLNKASKEAGYAELVSREEFMRDMSHYAVVIVIDGKYEWSSNRTHLCYEGSRYTDLISNGVCITEIISVKLKFMPQLFLEILSKSNWQNLGLTIVFGRWMGPFAPVEACQNGYRKEKFQFRPSARLVKDARIYNKMYMGNSENYTAVMLRMEHTVNVASKPTNNLTLDGCLQTVLDTVHHIRADKLSFPMVAADVGKYGSTTIRRCVKDKELIEPGINSTKSTILKLIDNKLSFSTWEESFVTATGGVTSPGYIAALQRTIASHAKCLVLMGGGNFQDLALQEYFRLHSEEERCVHFVCLHNAVLETRT